jgi:hypothetical protein
MRLLPLISLLVTGLCADINNSSDTTPDEIFRNEKITARLSQETIQGLRKMSLDEGEKFFLSYYSFASESIDAEAGNANGSGNSTTLSSNNKNRSLDRSEFLARSFPFESASFLERSAGFLGLEIRDFKCPAGTKACTSISRSDRCCGTGSTCEIITDTGSGDVGCCPDGEVCSGTVGSCASGYSTCSEALGGGCCIPGYECVSGGCEFFYLFLSWFSISRKKKLGEC